MIRIHAYTNKHSKICIQKCKYCVSMLYRTEKIYWIISFFSRCLLKKQLSSSSKWIWIGYNCYFWVFVFINNLRRLKWRILLIRMNDWIEWIFVFLMLFAVPSENLYSLVKKCIKNKNLLEWERLKDYFTWSCLIYVVNAKISNSDNE